jgi:CRP-like cAMP-binding protein
MPLRQTGKEPPKLKLADDSRQPAYYLSDMSSDQSPPSRWNEAEIFSLLTSSPSWLTGVADETVQAVIRAGRVTAFRTGEHVTSHLEHVTHVGLVLEGVLRVSSISLDGREHLVSLMEPGAIFGVISAMDGDVSPHSATADGDLTMFQIGVRDFRRLMEDHPDFRQAMQDILCERMRMAFAVLDQFAIGSPRARLAQRLIALGTSYGRKDQDGVLIDLHLTQDSLAAMIGLSRQRTNLILKNFEAEGLIQLNYGKVILRNIEALTEVVQDLS